MKTVIIIFYLFIMSFNSMCQKINCNEQETVQHIDWNYECGIQFINDYVDFCDDLNSNIGRLEWMEKRQDVTVEFKKELKRIFNEGEMENPEFGLDLDPILDAQDHPNQFEIESKDSEYLVVKGVDWQDFRLILKLKIIESNCYVDGAGIINIPKNKRIER